MNSLGQEFRIIQNPALGATLLWRFSASYHENHPAREFAPFVYFPLVLPLVWHGETLERIASTRTASGLRAFVSKFADSRESHLDALFGLHPRVVDWKMKSMDSFELATRRELIRFDQAGGIVPAEIPWKSSNFTQSIRSQLGASEKVGVWFACLSIREVAATLHLRF